MVDRRAATKDSAMATRTRHKPKEPWHAVRVCERTAKCRAAAALGRKRFLSHDAPRLPLPDCSAAWRCDCIYRHFEDRRAGPRRANERGIGEWVTMEVDRRVSRGRRATDGVQSSHWMG